MKIIFVPILAGIAALGFGLRRARVSFLWPSGNELEKVGFIE